MAPRRSSSRPGLTRLLAGLSIARFRERHWPDRALVVHGPARRLKGLADLPPPSELESLIARATGELLAQTNDSAQGFVNLPVQPSVAAMLFRRGLTLYAPEAVLGGASSARWVAALERDLALSPGLIRTAFFASPKGSGAGLHFDSQESFVVQLYGRKRWTFAPNPQLAFPPVNYVAGTPLPAELAQLVPGGFVTRMPKGAITVELKPGSVLFVPRGVWHTTLTTQDSLHVDLMMHLPNWGDSMLALVQQQLGQHAQWRSPMVSPEWLGTAFERLQEEVASLAQSMVPRTRRRPHD